MDQGGRPKGRPPGKPLYRRISEGMRERIIAGEWAPGEVLPTRRKLSQELGTTRITIDKAISELVTEGYLSATIGSGTYVVDRGPSAPETIDARRPSGRLERLGVVLGTGVNNDPMSSVVEDHVYFGGIYRGIRQALTGTDVGASYFQVDGSGYLPLLERPVDACIIIAPTIQDLPAFRLLHRNMPLVVIGISPTSEDDAAVPCIDTDNVAASRAATEYLIEIGHRSIGIVDLAISHGNHFDRLQGYFDAISANPEAVASFNNVLAYPAYDPVVWPSLLDRWISERLAAGNMPTALFVTDGEMTLAALQALRKHGLSIPGDISVVGFDDAQVMSHLQPPVTTMRQPAHEMGRRAALRLIDRFASGDPLVDPAGLERFPCELIVRQSTAPR